MKASIQASTYVGPFMIYLWMNDWTPLEQLKLYRYETKLVPFIYQKNEVFELHKIQHLQKLLILQEWDKMTVCWPPTCFIFEWIIGRRLHIPSRSQTHPKHIPSTSKTHPEHSPSTAQVQSKHTTSWKLLIFFKARPDLQCWIGRN